MKNLIRIPHFDNKDQHFATYLRKMGWEGAWRKVNGNTNYFINPHGSILAKVVYNNSECTFRVWI